MTDKEERATKELLSGFDRPARAPRPLRPTPPAVLDSPRNVATYRVARPSPNARAWRSALIVAAAIVVSSLVAAIFIVRGGSRQPPVTAASSTTPNGSAPPPPATVSADLSSPVSSPSAQPSSAPPIRTARPAAPAPTDFEHNL